MLKNLKLSSINKFKPQALFKHPFCFNFSRKIKKTSETENELSEDISTEDYLDRGQKLDYIRVYKGKYPFIPLDDHPLIPGYARMIAVPKNVFQRMKEMNVEETKMVISVCKNPEKIEGVQLAL